jgi:hypothetical protein
VRLLVVAALVLVLVAVLVAVLVVVPLLPTAGAKTLLPLANTTMLSSAMRKLAAAHRAVVLAGLCSGSLRAGESMSP